MLRVTIEIVPYGMEEYKRPLAKCEIWNEKQSATNPELADYGFRLEDDRWGKKTIKEGRIRRHNRVRDPVWSLVRKVIRRAGL